MMFKSKSILTLAAVAALALSATGARANTEVVYSNFDPNTLRAYGSNVSTSWNFEQVGNRIATVGDTIAFAPSSYGQNLDIFQTIVTMSEPRSTYPTFGTSNGYTVDITLNMTVNGVTHSDTFNTLIQWQTSSGSLRQIISFDISQWGLVASDEDIAWSLSFNTQHAGLEPTGLAGPTNSLNIGLIEGAGAWYEAYPWPDYEYVYFVSPNRSLGARFLMVPEPASLSILALAGISLFRRRKH